MVDQTEAIRIRLAFETEKAEKHAKRLERQLGSLEKRFDPLASATQKYDRGLKVLERSLESGKIDITRYEKNLENLNREFDAAKAKAAGAGAAVEGLNVATGRGSRMRQYRNIAQQAGYQIGDFAVQVQGGTSAITAFTQQGSQMLGVFGAFGAIAGAALAIGAPVAASLLGSGEAAADFSEKVENLSTAVDEYVSASQRANISTDELEAKYKGASDAARVFLGEIEKIAGVEAMEALAATVDDISTRFGGFNDVVSRSILSETGGRLSTEAQVTIRDIAKELEASVSEAFQLGDALEALGSATTAQEVADASRGLLDVMGQALGPFEDMNAEAQELYRQIVDVGDSAAELSGEIETSHASMLDFVGAVYEGVGGLDGMVSVADRLSATIANAAVNAWDFVGAMGKAQIEYASSVGGGRGGDPTKMGGSLRDYNNPRNRIFVSPGGASRRVRRGSSSGGGGRSASANREATRIEREAARVFRQTRTEIEKLSEEQAKLNELKAQGAIDGDTYSRAIGLIGDKLKEAKLEASGFKGIAMDFKESVIDAAMGGENAMDRFKNSIKRAAIEYALFGSGPFGKAFGGGIGTSGILGGLFGGFAGLFDKGGRVPSGKFAIAGERGPEIIQGPAHVTSTANTAKMLSQGSTPPIHISMYYEESDNLMPTVRAASKNVTLEVLAQAGAAQSRMTAKREARR